MAVFSLLSVPVASVLHHRKGDFWLSIDTSMPISLGKIRDNFGRPQGEDAGSGTRYVRDMAQVSNNVAWDLQDYSGRAFGMQGEFRTEGFTASGIYGLPLTQSDKRIDGAISNSVMDNNFIESAFKPGLATNGERSFTLNLKQSRYDSTPGALYLNGICYISEPGNGISYDFNSDLQLGKWEPGAEARIDVIGFRYGYLDGSSYNYARFETNGSESEGNVINWSGQFQVYDNYRHVVVAVRIWQPGGYGRDAESSFDIWNVEVKRS